MIDLFDFTNFFNPHEPVPAKSEVDEEKICIGILRKSSF